jgi:predicted RNase H-like HicB family nuclease
MDTIMFAEYIQAALEKAEYEVIDNPEPFYAHVPGLVGVWATGKTVEDCRKELIEVIEEWIVAKLQWGQPIPPMGGLTILTSSKEPISVA